MCTSQVTVKRLLKIFIEIVFYAIVINVGFLIAGYHPEGFHDIFEGFFSFLFTLGTNSDYYPALFLVLLLLIPFLNKLINIMSKKEHLALLIVLIFVFTIVSSFSFKYSTTVHRWYNQDVWEGIGWYCTVYLIGSFIRKHCSAKMISLKTGIISSITCVALSFLSISLLLYNDTFVSQYQFVAGSNKILAIGTAISFFILFKNLNIPNSRFINLVASGTFGVLLLHTNNEATRQLIWGKIFNINSYYSLSTPLMLLKMAGAVLLLYIVCTIISITVKTFILNPIFKLLDKTRFANKVLYTFKQ